MTEDFCGIPMDVSHRETACGTQYCIRKWTCPTCGKACSMLELDSEWSHGDSVCTVWRDGKHSVRCGSCWLATETAVGKEGIYPMRDWE